MRSRISSMRLVPSRHGTHLPQDSFCVKCMKKRATSTMQVLLIHDNEAAGADHRANLLQRIKIKRQIKMLLS